MIATITRWTANRKAEIVSAFEEGLITLADLAEHHEITLEEFDEWRRLYHDHGPAGLRATKLYRYRPHKRKLP